jgi:hypothetical protein
LIKPSLPHLVHEFDTTSLEGNAADRLALLWERRQP